MPGTHGAHELVELVAAILLSVGGGLILMRAALARRTVRPVPATHIALHPTGCGTTSTTSAVPSPIAAVRRAETLLAVGLSMAAAAIHLAAAPGHVEALGDIGLGFYWAALFQVGFAVALLARPRSASLARVGIVINLALVGAWGWSRLVGLPSVPGGPESIGVADATTVVLQLVLSGVLAARLRGLDRWLATIGSASTVRSVATSGLVTAIGIVFLSTTIAVADAVGGHAHEADGGHGHPSFEPAPVGAQHAPVGAQHAHGAPSAP